MPSDGTPTAYVKIFNEALSAIHATVDKLIAWQGGASWEALDPALVAIDKRVREHLAAIKAVRDTLIDSGDIHQAAILMNKLVQDNEIPIGYSSIKGTIEECSKSVKIGPITRDMLRG